MDRDPALSRIAVTGVDPGGMSTGLLRNGSWFLRNVAMKGIGSVVAPLATKIRPNGMIRTTTKSAADVLRASFDTATTGEIPKGVYYDGDQEQEPSAEAKDAKKQKLLWDDSARYVSLREEDTGLKEWQ